MPRAARPKRGGFLRELVFDLGDVDRRAYPFSIPAVADTKRLAFAPNVTFFVGENGSGKSTLIEAVAIAMGLNPEGGSENFSFAMRPSESELHRHVKPIRGVDRPTRRFFLRAETLFNVATVAEELGLQAYGWENVHERSHGEAFLFVLEERFVPGGFYILDEPEAALSPTRLLRFLAQLHHLVRGGAQLVIATHSPILLAYPHATIYELGPWGIRETDFESCEHVRVTREFLAHPDRFLKHLLGDDVP
ncbi:MAG: AAA family ATPase [Sandaracinus sp.]|nr:AAA family ATPase [Sandaracinus sp.]MCB9625364.1 AAA family ATPase [Sandaracinus sp.]